MTIDNHKIGKRVQETRKRRGFTQEKLAEEIDCTASFLSYVETGKKTMSLDTLILIANALRCSTDELLMDVLENDDTAWNSVVAHVLEDCTSAEKQVITNTLITLKHSLKVHMGFIK